MKRQASIMENDKYLHSLLLSQQHILNQMDLKAERRNSLFSDGPNTFDVFANESIANPSKSHKMLFSKRLSMGSDIYAMPNSRRLSFGNDIHDMLSNTRRLSIGSEIHDALPYPKRLSIGNDTFAYPFSRRLSIGNDNYVLSNVDKDGKLDLESLHYDITYNDCHKTKTSCPSEDTTSSCRSGSTLGVLQYLFDNYSSKHQEHPQGEDISVSDSLPDEEEMMDPDALRREMLSFDEAMHQTQLSQKKIHDWDRKMGLKRSHSKTMRLSARSRKKLRTQIQEKLSEEAPGLKVKLTP